MVTKDDRDKHVETYRVAEQHPMDQLDHTGVLVKPKWRGTSLDKMDMEVLGRNQVLRRNFRFLSMLGFGSTLICTWEILLANILFISVDGGTADLFWGYIVVFLGIGLTYASMAEMASMAPTAGGQYHWVSEFAPPRYQKFLSYIVGTGRPFHKPLSASDYSNQAEEVEDASRTLPRSIMWSVYLNGAMGFIMAVTMCYTLGDLSEIVDTSTGYPFIQVFYNATQSYAATNVMVTIMIVTLTACCISVVATSSRQLWSFARDKGIPLSNWFAYVSL
ncbi:MAG: hypothetical protein Q9201_002570 [Fulgogasparrea decipioides]